MDVESPRTNVLLKSNAQQLLEGELGRPLEDVLDEWYRRDRLTQAEIAEKLGGLNQSTVTRWMRQLGIPVRYGSERARRLRVVPTEEIPA